MDERCSHRQIDDIVTDVVAAMKQTAKNNIPKSRFNPHLKPFWSAELSSLRDERDDCHRIWSEAGKPSNPESVEKRNLKAAKKVFRREYRKAEKKYEDAQNNDLKRAHSIDQNYFWSLVRRARKKEGAEIYPVVNDDGVLVSEADSIRDAWRSYFHDLAQPAENDEYDEDFKVSVDATIDSIKNGEIKWNSPHMNEPFTSKEVEKARKKLKWKKAPGWDEISTEHLRHGGSQFLKLVTVLFNKVRLEHYFPVNFRRGVRIPLYKGSGKKKEDRTSYRGITLLSIFSKWLEHILLGRAMDGGCSL